MPAIAIESSTPSVVPVSEDRFLKTSQAAQYLNLTAETMKSYRKSGDGPRFHRVNDRLVLYRLSDLVSYVLRNQERV
jgi:hypothetical protein